MNNIIVKRGMVFLADLGMGIGSEQGGLRPVVILQNDTGNKYSPTVIVATITSQMSKAKLPTHVKIHRELGLEKDSVVLLEQIRTIDKNRLEKFCCKLNRETMKKIDRAMNISLDQLDIREEEAIKQADEVRYWKRNVDELLDDTYASKEQIKQRVLKLQIEYAKLRRICEFKRLYVEKYFIMDEIKYMNIMKENERIAM